MNLKIVIAAQRAAVHNSAGRKNLDSIFNHNPLRSQSQSFAHEKSLPRGLRTLVLSQRFCDALMRLTLKVSHQKFKTM